MEADLIDIPETSRRTHPHRGGMLVGGKNLEADLPLTVKWLVD